MGLLHAIIGIILAGIALEILFTSISNFIKKEDIRLQGKSYLWMFPIYGIAALIFLLITSLLMNIPLIVRGLIYMILFTLLEFTSGMGIKTVFGKSPWNYSRYKIKVDGKKYKSNFKGVVCLRYIPIWFICGILGEIYFLFLMKI